MDCNMEAKSTLPSSELLFITTTTKTAINLGQFLSELSKVFETPLVYDKQTTGPCLKQV